MLKYLNLEDFNYKGKVVCVRSDLNSAIKNGKVLMSERIKEATLSINYLISKGAKVVVLAHQGRKGKKDFTSLKSHSSLLSKALNKKIYFEQSLQLEHIKESLSKLKEGSVLLLENIRELDHETKPPKKGNDVIKIIELCDYYAFDAFSVAHRAHSSVLGSSKVPQIAGKLMKKELDGLSTIEGTSKPHMFLFGGAKPDDLIELLKVDLHLGNVDLVLLTGVIGELALYLKGAYLGKKLEFMKDQSFLDHARELKELMNKYPNSFVYPKDVALSVNGKRAELSIKDLDKNKELLDENMIEDIGKNTISYFSTLLQRAGSIYIKGPAGNFEEDTMGVGTQKLFKAVVQSKGFSFMGGGHTVTAATQYNVLSKFSYVSLAGGALVHFLSGKNLPGIVSLLSSYENFHHKRIQESYDYIVVGSNVVDINVEVPKHLSEVVLGDKIRIEHPFKKLLGGGGINVSTALSRLNCRVGYLGKCTQEGISDIYVRIKDEGFTLLQAELSKKSQASSVILDTKDDDRIIYTYRGQNSDLSLKDFSLDHLTSNKFYFSSLLGESFKTQLKIAKHIKQKDNNSLICYNTSSYLIRNEKKSLLQLLSHIDILILNLDEAQELTSKQTVSQCLQSLYKLGPSMIVITDGARGSYAYTGSKEIMQKAVKAHKIVDTTGAGDCFAATFFYCITHHMSIKKSLYFAAKNASNVVEYKGPSKGLMRFKELMK